MSFHDDGASHASHGCEEKENLQRHWYQIFIFKGWYDARPHAMPVVFFRPTRNRWTHTSSSIRRVQCSRSRANLGSPSKHLPAVDHLKSWPHDKSAAQRFPCKPLQLVEEVITAYTSSQWRTGLRWSTSWRSDLGISLGAPFHIP